MLVSDYAKGVCTCSLLQNVIREARRLGKPVVVDPARRDSYERYAQASLLTPNRQEAERAAKHPVETPEDAILAGRLLKEEVGVDQIAITLDRDGIALVDQSGVGHHLPPAESREVYDITGAGDVVLAVLGLCLSGDAELRDAAVAANCAGGIAVGRLGVVAVTSLELERGLRSRHRAASHSGPLDLPALEDLVVQHRRAGKSIALTNGCFDLLHVGHVDYLAEASQQADVLIVAINSDRSVRELKGPERPIIKEQDRARMAAALRSVDHVVLFDESTPHELLRRLKPDVLVKGGTYTVDEVVGREIVLRYGGRVAVTGQVDGVSTTDILSIIESRAALVEESKTQPELR